MQLNSLTLNSSEDSPLQTPHLAVYDHKLAVVNSEIFVFGKNIQNFSVQTPLHKINMKNLRVEHVLTVNAPQFQDFIMFSFNQLIYFWGKTSHSSKNQLFQFDGSKFTKLSQSGSIPNLQGPYSFSIFSHQYLLLFGSLNQKQFLNRWYFFDIQKRFWKTIFCPVQIPACQFSSMLWKEGRGYLLLQSIYLKNQKSLKKNILYEVKFKNFKSLILDCVQIALSPYIQSKDITFTNIFSFSDNYLMIMGGDQKSFLCVEKQKRINFDTHKIVYKFDLEQFQWSEQYKIIQIKGYHHQIACFNSQIFTVGGNYNNEILRKIQSHNFQTQKQNQIFPYEQGLCYYCQSAFTYDQKLIYSPIVERQYDIFCPKNRVQNKFFRKFAQSISTQIQAISIVCDFFQFQQSQEIKINLCQQIKLNSSFNRLKTQIQNPSTEVLCFTAKINRIPSVQMLKQIISNNQNIFSSKEIQQYYLKFTKAKIASFKVGIGMLFVNYTSSDEIFVCYSSCSQTDFPECQLNSFSQIFYTVSFKNGRCHYSSQINRQIVFQNVKLYFGTPEDYQNTYFQSKNSIKRSQINQWIYIIGVTNLQRGFNIELSQNKYYEDIKIKSLNKSNTSNSLRNYLKLYYLIEKQFGKFYIQKQPLQFVKLYEKYLQLSKTHGLKQISTGEQILNKNQQQDTHFSTTNDQTVINWKKIDIIDKCKLYELNSKKGNTLDKIYSNIFVYKTKKLVKTVTLKRLNICGVIQLNQTVETTLDETNLSFKSDQKKMMLWLELISTSIFEESIPSSEYI